ncbi:MAG: putative signal transducing protein [Solirubrobacterales bacterium]
MEIIERDEHSRDGLVQIAFAETREEAALMRGLLREEGIRSLAKQASINGPALGAGLLTRSSRRIYVRPEDAEAARRLLSETMVEDPQEEEVPEPANAAYLADATSHRPRDYGLLGAYARAWIAAVVILAVALVIFILLH